MTNDLEELKKLLAAATPGDWENSDGNIWVVGVEMGITEGCCGNFLRSGECCGNAIPVQVEEQVQVRIGGMSDEDAALTVWLKANADALIERVERAEAALKPFSEVATHDIGDDETDDDLFRPMKVRFAVALPLTVGDFRRARAALNPNPTNDLKEQTGDGE